jgi:hypothetical protein
MATFEIEANGRKFRVEAPDAAAAAQAATAYAAPPSGDPQKLSGQPAAGGPMPTPATPLPIVPEQYRGGKVSTQNLDNSLSAQMDEVPWYKQAAAGFGSAPVQAYQGIKQLLGGKVDERDIRDQRDITSTGAGAIGNIAGNLAMLAIPGGLAEKGIRGAAMLLPKALQFLKYGTVPAVAAAETALTRPTVEGESRGEETLKSAAMAGAVGTGLKAAGRAYAGLVKPSKLGQELLDQGIQPTAGEGGKGVMGAAMRFGEDVLTTMGFRPGHDLANAQAMSKIKEQATPAFNTLAGGVASAENISRKGKYFSDVSKEFEDAYGAILDNKIVPMPAIFRTTVLKKARAAVPEASDEVFNEFSRKMGAIYSGAKGNAQTAGQWKQMLNEISEARRDALETAGTEAAARKLAKLYGTATQELMNRALATKGLTKAELDSLNALNTSWAKHQVLKDAALLPRGGTGALSGAPGERLVSIDDIITASERGAPDVQKLGEKEFFAGITRPMSEVLARRGQRGTVQRQLAYGAGGAIGLGGAYNMGKAGLTAALLAPIVGAAAAGTTKTGSKILMGNTAHQKRVADMLRTKIDPRLGTIAASFDTDENEE